jgi:magnesium chelatase subunit D
VSTADDRARRLTRALACSALDPDLDGVLLTDAHQRTFDEAARTAADLLAAATGRRPRTVVLGAATQEDDLWLTTRMWARDGTLGVSVRPGPLVGESESGGAGEGEGGLEGDRAPVLVLVHDLARLSLAGTRAAVQLLGATHAHVERYGQSHRWRPTARWIAACRTTELPRVSDHLLDRFPLRVDCADGADAADGADPTLARTLAELAADGEHNTAGPAHTPSPAPWPRRGDDAVDRVTGLVPTAVGQRPALALARTGRALAALDRAATVTPAHVDAAARLLGITRDRPAPPRPELDRPEPEPPEPPRPAGPPPGAGATAPAGSRPAVHAEPAEPLETFDLEERPAEPTRHPADDPDPLRTAESLRSPPRRSGAGIARGPVVGVRPAVELRDLAWVPTAIEAAKYQRLPVRRAAAGDRAPGQLVVAPGDLRSYARSPAPELMLTLLVDHTCRAGWDLESALAPSLQWAYVGRASVGVVELGHRTAAAELRAEAFTTRNVLDPRVAAVLRRSPGRATPLAHGLFLAQQLLRRALQHQRSGLAEARLVVVTDGRGNVPLAASGAGRVTGPVGRTGVEDALTVARHIGAMDRMRLRTVVVDPGAQPYGELPFALADALGGEVVVGRDPAAVTADDRR